MRTWRARISIEVRGRDSCSLFAHGRPHHYVRSGRHRRRRGDGAVQHGASGTDAGWVCQGCQARSLSVRT